MFRLSQRSLTAIALATLLTACQTIPERPMLYPNAHLNTVGDAQAQIEIDGCMKKATDYGVAESKDGQVGKRAAQGAAIGGISSGVWGLVRGDAGELAAAGAAAGMAGGATRGAIDSSKTNPVFKTFVQKCLSDQGYEIIGWQ